MIDGYVRSVLTFFQTQWKRHVVTIYSAWSALDKLTHAHCALKELSASLSPIFRFADLLWNFQSHVAMKTAVRLSVDVI